MPKEPGEPQLGEDEPKIEQISEATAKEIEELREHYASLVKIGDLEKEIREAQNVLDDKRKQVKEKRGSRGELSQEVIDKIYSGVIPYNERRIKLAKAEIRRREVKGER